MLSFVDMTCFRPIVNNDIIQRLNEIPMISQKFREIQLVTKFMKWAYLPVARNRHLNCHYLLYYLSTIMLTIIIKWMMNSLNALRSCFRQGTAVYILITLEIPSIIKRRRRSFLGLAFLRVCFCQKVSSIFLGSRWASTKPNSFSNLLWMQNFQNLLTILRFAFISQR